MRKQNLTLRKSVFSLLMWSCIAMALHANVKTRSSFNIGLELSGGIENSILNPLQSSITGTVTDEAGTLLPGVTILERGNYKWNTLSLFSFFIIRDGFVICHP